MRRAEGRWGMQTPVVFDGSALLRLRKARGWSQAQLSKKSGISVSHISQLEQGTRKTPSVDRVFRLSEALGVSMYRLISPVARETDVYPAPEDAAYLSGEGATLSETNWLRLRARLERDLPPDVVAFVVREEAEPYLTFVRDLHEHRHSTADVLRLVSEFFRLMPEAHEGATDARDGRTGRMHANSDQDAPPAD
jgi:transcriptional regulator with XRE-family HTH domain